MAVIGGTGGDDVLRGTPGDDVLWGGIGNDELMGLAGDDRLEGGAGADVLNGGPGRDIADFVKSPQGVRVHLGGTAGSGGHAEGDVLTGIEDVWGSRFDDRIFGDGENNRLFGGEGYDYLEGGADADVLDGGEDGGYDFRVRDTTRDNTWGDTAGYTTSDAGVTVNLATGTAEGGHAEGDTLRGIESVRGSDHADMLTARDDDPDTDTWPPEGSILWGQKGDDELHGGTGHDILWGGKGDDTLLGGAGFNYLEGGAGADVLDGGYAGYTLSDAGVTVDLEAGTASGGHAEGDTLTGIGSLGGSQHADHLIGDDGFNSLEGLWGDDTLDGGAGNDGLHGGAGDDTLDGGEGDDWLDGGAGDDTLDGGEGDDNLDGGAGGDTLDGGAGNDYLAGWAGADMLNGGEGDDRAAYWMSDAGVTVNLATGEVQGGHAEGDTLTGIENITGSYHHADHLTGDDENNDLDGGAGDDTLDGGAGIDDLDGDAGADMLAGGEGDDELEGGVGADMLDGGEGNDRAAYWWSVAGVTVSLATGTGQGGDAEGDTLTGIENVTGSHNHADHLTGDDGNNDLNGLSGDDTLDGGAGNDELEGGAGADMLDGGEGDDTLRGGEGDDVFYFGDGDTIADFVDGSDMIDISALDDIRADNFEANATIQARSGGGVEVVIGDAVLTVLGVSPADITAEDFLFA